MVVRLTFAELISLTRKRSGVSADALAAQVGIGVSTLRTYESGQRVPTLTVAARIGSALDLSLDDMAATLHQPAAPMAHVPRNGDGTHGAAATSPIPIGAATAPLTKGV